ncbi:hypothetical protein [Nonomuraea dietziae]
MRAISTSVGLEGAVCRGEQAVERSGVRHRGLLLHQRHPGQVRP